MTTKLLAGKLFDGTLVGKAPVSAIDAVEPTWREVIMTFVVTIFFAFGIGLETGAEDTISTIGLLAFSAILGWGGYRQITRNVATLWTPILWYRVAMMSYFGVGSLVPIWTNGITRDMMNSFYEFFSYEILKLNLLMTIFHSLFLITAKIMFMLFKENDAFKKRDVQIRGFINPSNFSMAVFGTICLCVGSAVNYFVVFPQIVGWVNFTLFSTLYNFAALSWLGYFMVALWALENKKILALVAVILVALGESVIGFFAMSKSVILLPMVMLGLAFIYNNRSIFRILMFGVLFISTYMFLSPMITYVREINQGYYSGQVTAYETPALYAAYLGGDTVNNDYADLQTGWARLSYVNAGTFAISQYDQGIPGNSYRYWAIVWIPRAIYPDKPFITDVSREFSYAANGNYNSSSSPGLAAEGYWNAGWFGVIGVALLLAATFALWSLYSFIVIQRQAWHLFFVVLLGMRTAIRVDGAFVSDIVGPIGIAVLAHITLELLNRFLPQMLGGSFTLKNSLN